MSPNTKSTPVKFSVNPQDPSTYLKPGEPLIGADGRDWSWAYVWFKDIDGFPGYKVEWHGTVWTCRRICDFSGENKWGETSRWKQRAIRRAPDGYHEVIIYLNGKRSRLEVHQLVVSAFWGPRPDGFVARHLDGNKERNRADNLKWGTFQENSDDRIGHGTVPLGSKHPGAKMTEADVLRVLEMRGEGLSGQRIAEIMGRGHRTIYDILQGRTWSHLTGTVFPNAPHAVLKRHDPSLLGT